MENACHERIISVTCYFHGCDYLGTLEEFLVVPVEFERLLEVEVGGGQRDGEVDPSYVGQDGVL